MNAMNPQESIIALLQGDLTDQASVSRLLESIAGSAERQQILLRQISMMRKLQTLGTSVVPTTAADTGVLEGIARFEREAAALPGASYAKNGKEGKERGIRGSVPVTAFVAGIIIALCTGLAGGYLVNGRNGNLLESPVGINSKQSISGAGDIKNFSISPADSSSTPSSSRDSHKRDKRKDEIPDADVPPILSGAASVARRPAVRFRPELSPDTSDPLRSMTSARLDLPVLSDSVASGGLRVRFPNGAESLKAGEVVPLAWDGIPDTTSVVVQVSGDAGRSWQMIGRDVVGGKLLWKIPSSVKGEKYLAKVSRADSAGLNPESLQGFSHDTTLNIPAFSPDGTIVAVPDYRGNILFWNIRDHTLIHALTGHAKSVIQVVFSPDGKSLVSTSLDGTARLWDVGTGKERYQIAGRGVMQNATWTAAFSSTGDTVALGNNDGTVTLWDALSGKELAVLDIHTQAVRAIFYTRDGRRLITCSTDGDAKLSDAKTGAEIQRFAGHRGLINGVGLNREETILITGGFDGTVKFWDVRTGRENFSVEYFGGEKVGKILLTADDQFLVVAGFGQDLKLVDPASGDVLVTIPIQVTNKGIGAWPAFSSDSQILGVAHEDNLLLWKLIPNSDVSDGPWSIE